ncbi:ABC transporter permease [Rhizobium sp. TRM95111]|uniref:ABC transporter permease n=1 Tax=Rhizobium alarense TaxID=2846851 RepID=UPI001F48A461|nr:ABC transporter permease [Rhizobium alarense]MCF3640946.1 ABC transporter permease [Rhizobium alarense]
MEYVEKGFRYALSENIRIVTTLVIRNALTRFGDGPMGIFWALAEPGAMIGIYLLMHGVIRAAIPFGDNAILFFLTGILAFRMTRAISAKTEGAISQNQSMLTFPLIRPLDTVVAAFLFELILWAVISTIFITFVTVYLDRSVIVYPLEFTACLISIIYFAFAFGVFNATFGVIVPLWKTILGMLGLPLMIASGILFVPSSMPPEFITIIWWNPFLHCVEWFRSTTYLDYHTVLSKTYLWSVSTILLTTGLALERLFRNRIINE